MWSVVKDVVKVDIFVQQNFCFGVVTEMVAKFTNHPTGTRKVSCRWCAVGLDRN